MITEVFTASHYITGLIRSSGVLTVDQLDRFRVSLQEALLEHYRDCWFPEDPSRGSDYRCLNIDYKLGPLICKAGRGIGITKEKLLSLFPSELTLWVDPNEVSYHIGEDETVYILYSALTPWHNPQSPFYE